MKKFITGFISGIVIGGASAAAAAQLVGSSGYLLGYEVTLNGDTICRNPYVWTATREIDCD